MKTKRIIARLDVKNDALVKGIHLEGLRVLGAPDSFAEIYYNEGVDELVYMDVVASLYNRNGLSDFVKRTANKIFIPLSVGGGIRKVEDVRELLNSGADKVIINTAAVRNPKLITELAQRFGSSTIVVAIEAIKDSDTQYGVYIDNGREYTGKEVISWAKTVEELGAGEILLTSVDREGTGKGLDYNLIELVKNSVSIPVIAHGGISSVGDIETALTDHGIDAICASSIFHYEVVARPDYMHQDVSGNTSFLRSGNQKKNLDPISVKICKSYLKSHGVKVR
ncbi:imidazole glycerol phosphate synthase subunit HisF [Vibrio metoecus]